MQNIVLNYGDLKVLENFSLKGETKQFICLFGPSGIGKTTILNVLAGILKPDYGKVTLDN